MQPARVLGRTRRGHLLGHGREERNHVVSHLGFDGLDASNLEIGVFAKRAGGLDRHYPQFGECLRSAQLDLEPLSILVLVGPNSGHDGSRVARDHCPSFSHSIPSCPSKLS